ncbi:MAG: cupin domain-containing protein [Solirubrobacterales bacterium]
MDAGQELHKRNPWHFHYCDEEVVIVLSGQPSLRTPDGVRDLKEGEAVRFGLGEEGAHQILNPTDRPVRFLALANNSPADIVVYPDSDKISVVERRPEGGGVRFTFRREEAVDFWDGESGSEAS